MSPDLGPIYDAHATALFAFLLNLTRSEAEARDLVQDVFVKLATRPSLLDGVRDARPWLLRLAHRQMLDAVRRRGAHDCAIESASREMELFVPAECDPEADAFRAAVARAMAELPADQRAVVHLKIWEDLTFAQIAGALDIPANTAASRYRYAIDKLEALLRPLHDEPR
jgi:RNA polymerase sigma-70 factor (ECF subfamily)